MRKSCLAGLCAFLFLACLVPVTRAQLTSLTEGFDTVGSAGPPATGIFATGWLVINNSSPLGDQNWNQGIPGTGTDGLGVNAQSGNPNSFIQTNFGVANGGIASDWLITPVLELENGATISFYTQTNIPVNTMFPNELQVWESQSGASTVNVGSTAASPGGDFTVQLLDINPGATAENGTPGGYPTTWTEYTLTISGLSAPTNGRIGFRYYLPNAANQGTTIGIDTFSFADPTLFTRTVSGNWTDTTGWTPSGVPNGNTVTAQLVNPGSGTNTVDLGGGTFTLNQLQFSGTGAGSWDVVDGTIIFDGTNPIFVNQGGTSGAIGELPNLQLNVNTTFEIDNSAAVTDVTGAITGVGELVETGSGTLELTGTNTYTGGTTISAGTLQIGNGGTTGSITGDVTDNGTLAFDRSDTVTFGGAISGTGGLTQLGGGGTLILTGTNAYTGGTTISAGTLQIGNGGTAGSITGDVTDNGTLAFDRSDSVTFGGVISGSGGLAQLGTGTLILTGANTYSGGTTIGAGTLQIGDGGTTGSIAGNVADNAALVFDRSDNFTVSGSISGTGTVTQAGTGTVELSGNNTYSGATDVASGTLQAGSTTAFSANSAYTVTSVLDLNGFNNTIGSVTGTGTVTNNGAAIATLTTGSDNSSTTFSGILEDGTSVLQLAKTGTGTLTLTGANTYSGGTSFNGGTVAVDSDSNLGTGALSFNGGTLEALTAGGGIVSSKSVTLNSGGGTFLADSGTTSTLNGTISGVGSLTKAGVGTLILTGANSYTGGTTISAGTLQIGNGGTTGSIVGNMTDNGALVLDLASPASLTISGSITGTGSLTQSGSGATTLTGTNTYTGGTTVTGGALVLGNSTTTGSIAGAVLVQNGNPSSSAREVNFNIINANTSGITSITTIGNGFAQSASTTFLFTSTAGTANISNSNAGTTTFLGSFGGPGSSAGSATITNSSDGGTFFDNSSTAANATINNQTGGVTQFLQTSTAANANITNNSQAVTEFFNSSTAGNATITTKSGGVTFFEDSSTGGLATLVTNAGGSVDLSHLSSGGMTAGSIAGAGTYALGSSTLTVGGNDASTTVSGTIEDGGVFGGTGGALTKVGTGTLTLTGTNTYTGGTNFNAGTVAVDSDSNLGTGALSFDGGALEALAAGGGIASSKAVTLNAGGGTFLADTGTSSTLSGQITGGGMFTKDGPGTLILEGDNTYTGQTDVVLGTLRAGSVTGLSLNSAFVVTTSLDLNGFNNTIGSLSGAGTVTNDGVSAAALTVGNDNTSTTFSGILENGTSVLELTKTGTGTLILTGNNTYSGDTTISAGTLQIGNPGTTGSIAGNIIDNAALLFDRSDTFALSGSISGTGTVTQEGTGIVELTGNNTYSGATNVSAGTLQAGSPTALSADSAYTVTSVLDLNGFSNTIGSLTGTGTVTNNGVATATLTVGNENTSTTFSGMLEDGTSVLQLTKTGTGTLTLTGNNTYSGTTNVAAGTLRAGAPTAFSADSAYTVTSVLDLNGFSNTIGSLSGTGLVTNDGAAAATLTVGTDDTSTTFSGIFEDGTSVLQLTKTGTGTLTLTGNNTYSGATNVALGTLQAGSPKAFSANSAFTVTSVLDLNGFSNTIGSLSGTGTVTNNDAGPAILTTGGDNAPSTFSGVLSDGSGTLGVTKTGSGTMILAGANTYTGGTTITGGTLQIGNGGTTGSIVGNITDNAALEFDRSDIVTFAGTIAGSGILAQAGSGTLILTADNTFTGTTNISLDSTLQLGNGGTTGTVAGNVVDNGLLIFNRSNTLNLAAIISGTGSVQQNGSGTTILSGTNTYTGGTVVNAGTLTVNNPQALGLGSVVVNGGILNADPQPINVKGDYTQNAGGTLQLQVAGANPGQYDTLNVGGNATLGGTLQLISLGFQPKARDELTLVTAGGAVSGRFATFLNPFTAGNGIKTIDLVYGAELC